MKNKSLFHVSLQEDSSNAALLEIIVKCVLKIYKGIGFGVSRNFVDFFYKNRIVLSVYMIVLPNCQSLIVIMYVFICGKILISILIRIFHAQLFHRPGR